MPDLKYVYDPSLNGSIIIPREPYQGAEIDSDYMSFCSFNPELDN